MYGRDCYRNPAQKGTFLSSYYGDILMEFRHVEISFCDGVVQCVSFGLDGPKFFINSFCDKVFLYPFPTGPANRPKAKHVLLRTYIRGRSQETICRCAQIDAHAGVRPG